MVFPGATKEELNLKNGLSLDALPVMHSDIAICPNLIDTFLILIWPIHYQTHAFITFRFLLFLYPYQRLIHIYTLIHIYYVYIIAKGGFIVYIKRYRKNMITGTYLNHYVNYANSVLSSSFEPITFRQWHKHSQSSIYILNMFHEWNLSVLTSTVIILSLSSLDALLAYHVSRPGTPFLSLHPNLPSFFPLLTLSPPFFAQLFAHLNLKVMLVQSTCKV